MSKDSNKKNSKNTVKQIDSNKQTEKTPELTPEERARIIRDAIANRPVIIFRYRNGKPNWKLIITLAILLIALIVSLYYVTR
jgi:hypothetical protein